MFQKYLLVIGIAAFMGMASGWPAWAGPCGGSTVCKCGDTVEEDRTLTGADPVLKSVCSGNGLIMNTSGVRLNLRGGKIKGDGDAGDSGILILAGVNNVEIIDGQIDKFGTGIKSEATTTGSLIQENGVKGCTGNGIDVAGDFNEFVNNRHLAGNGGHGLVVTGNDNHVTQTRAVDNQEDGIVVTGARNDVSFKNQSSKNGGNGITVVGDDNVLDENNQIHHNGGYGIRASGSGNFLRRNATIRDEIMGILVTGGGNIDGGANNYNVGPQRFNKDDCQIDGVDCLP